MTDDNNKPPRDDFTEAGAPDPLGIIGWVIGGKYKITSYISGGGFGEVYRGHNVNLTEQKLVIKFFKRVQAREKFAKEAKILCLLDHPNISRVIDFLPDEGAVVVAYIDGKDGARILKESGALPEKLYLKVARSMASAVAYAHEKKIGHRDIKPANILVDKRENVYLIDFGIAKEIGGDATKTGYQALTPMFAAPERQEGGKDYNPFLSDIYELGITLYNFATNSLPYRNPISPNISEWGGSSARRLSPELRRILKKATHPDPVNRYKTAGEIAEDLRNLEAAFQRPRKSPAIIAVSLLVILAVAGYFGRGYIAETWRQMFPPEQASVAEPDEAPALDEPETPSAETAAGDDILPPPGQEDREEIIEEKPPIPEQTPSVPEVVEEKSEPEPEPEPLPPPEPEEQVAVIEEKPQPPPPPPMSELMVRVTPGDDVSMRVDGTGRPANTPFEIKPGTHEIAVIHPDFPLYRHNHEIAGDRPEVTVDLVEMFAYAESVEIQLALLPPTDRHILELTLNGRMQTITRFPVFDLKRAVGEWAVNLKIIPIEAAAESIPVDSCVAFPYGGGPRQVIKGGEGVVKIGSLSGESISSVPLVIYWTDR